MSDDAKKKAKKECEEACEEKVKNAEGQQDEAKDSDGSFSGAERESSDPDKKESEQPEKDQEEEALNVKYLRLMADFQNFKRRTEKEKGDIYAVSYTHLDVYKRQDIKRRV